MDSHYLCTHGVAQHAKVNVLSLRRLQEIEVKDAGRFDVTIFCTDADRLNMSISNQYIGTIALTYSTLIGQKGLGFAMFPLETDDRKGISGPTPGSLAVLNKCELLKNHVDGVLFNGSQIVPQRFLGAVDTSFLHFDLDRDENYVPTVPPRDQGEVGPWDFSGFYEFDAPDFYCLKVNEFMPKDFDYIPIMNTKGVPKRGRKDPGRICPRLKGYLVVDALMADTPIINLDVGADFVIHLLDGPEWKGARNFRLSSPSGDTSQVSKPIWQIQGRVIDPDTLEIALFGPRGQRGEPFTATKNLDFYGKIGVRPTAHDEAEAPHKGSSEGDPGAMRRGLAERLNISR